MDTGIYEQISTLRQRVAAVDAEIDRSKSARRGAASHDEARALEELIEAREFMTTRLRRLESCRRRVGD